MNPLKEQQIRDAFSHIINGHRAQMVTQLSVSYKMLRIHVTELTPN